MRDFGPIRRRRNRRFEAHSELSGNRSAAQRGAKGFRARPAVVKHAHRPLRTCGRARIGKSG